MATAAGFCSDIPFRLLDLHGTCEKGNRRKTRQEACPATGSIAITANALGDGLRDHGRAGAAYLTATHPKKTAAIDIRTGISVDQMASQRIESETKKVEKQNAQTRLPLMAEPPSNAPDNMAEHSKLMATEQSTRPYREIGVAEGHHGLTHHQGDKEKIEKVTQINHFHVELFTYLLAKLKATPDGDGSLLDHSMIVYGSGLSDGNRHLHETCRPCWPSAASAR